MIDLEGGHLTIELSDLFVALATPLRTLADDGLELLLKLSDDVGQLLLLLEGQFLELLRGEDLFVPDRGKDKSGRGVEQGDSLLLGLLTKGAEGGLVSLFDLFVDCLSASPKALGLEGGGQGGPKLFDEVVDVPLQLVSASWWEFDQQRLI